LDAAAEPAPVAFDVAAYQEKITKQAKENLQRLSQTYILEGLNFERIVVTGAPANNIVMLADDLKVDMIVIATHGHTGWRRLILGSVTEIVIRNAPCYVLTVPAPTDENQQ
jgi:nucleotide-binding universal stress UspA family protein